VIVVSIPDYAYTPARLWKASSISYEIDNYCQKYCDENNIVLLALLRHMRKGLMDTELVGKTDYTHQKAYSLFVERIAP
jgi:hypothetical protein